MITDRNSSCSLCYLLGLCLLSSSEFRFLQQLFRGLFPPPLISILFFSNCDFLNCGTTSKAWFILPICYHIYGATIICCLTINHVLSCVFFNNNGYLMMENQ